MGTLASKCVGKWGTAAQGVDVVSWRSWRQGGDRSGRGPEGRVCLVWLWDLESGCSQSEVPVIGHSQLFWGSWQQGAVS